MRHPFDGLTNSGGLTRRGALTDVRAATKAPTLLHAADVDMPARGGSPAGRGPTSC